MDRGDNNHSYSNVSLPFPFPDAIQEFSVQTSGLSARYGLHAGGVMNVVTKSGTARGGRTRTAGGVMSARLIDTAAAGDVTNIFLFSHGWMGDVPPVRTLNMLLTRGSSPGNAAR